MLVTAALTVAASMTAAAPAAASPPPAPTTTAPTTTAPTTTAPTTTAPTTTAPPAAPPVNETTLHADQVAVVTAAHQPAVNAASGRLLADEARDEADRSALAAAQAAVAGDSATARSAVAALAADVGAHSRAVAAHDASAARLAADRRRLPGVAVVLYEGVPSPPTAPSAPGSSSMLSGQQETTFARWLVQNAVVAMDGYVSSDVADYRATADLVRRSASAVGRDSAALALDRQAQAEASQSVTATAHQLAVLSGRLATDRSSLAAAQAALAHAVAALAGTTARPPARGDSSPSILGPSALDAGQLVSWFDSSGYVDLTSAPIGQLAQWYIQEGDAEGVRGDIAFAQAVLETGGFSSPDAVNLNNYAGVGHCDACAAGWSFPSPRMGVRGQIQLLAAYAQPGLTASQLAEPPAIPGVAPQKQTVRGCCMTWQSLTGVWATDPIYGPSILNLYQLMLDSALGRRSSGG